MLTIKFTLPSNEWVYYDEYHDDLGYWVCKAYMGVFVVSASSPAPLLANEITEAVRKSVRDNATRYLHNYMRNAFDTLRKFITVEDYVTCDQLVQSTSQLLPLIQQDTGVDWSIGDIVSTKSGREGQVVKIEGNQTEIYFPDNGPSDFPNANEWYPNGVLRKLAGYTQEDTSC